MKTEDKPGKRNRKIMVGVICLIMAFTIIPRAKTVWELSAQKTQLEQQKNLLQKTNKELARKAKEANTPEHIEKLAREQLGMVKKGETALVQVNIDK